MATQERQLQVEDYQRQVEDDLSHSDDNRYGMGDGKLSKAICLPTVLQTYMYMYMIHIIIHVHVVLTPDIHTYVHVTGSCENPTFWIMFYFEYKHMQVYRPQYWL